MAKEVKETKEEKLKKLLEQMEKDYGKGAVISANSTKSIEGISTGSLNLDLATGCGGLPRGKLVEIFGMESSGKSTITLTVISEWQKAGMSCVLVDTEHSFDRDYAEAIGIDLDKLLISQPNSMEDAYNIIEKFIKSGEVQLIVLDSHTAAVPQAELDGEIGDVKMAPQARINSQALRKLHKILDLYGCTLLGVSQLRTNIGAYGDPNQPTGGNGWKFYSDIRMKVSKSVDKENDQNKTVVEVIKNKCGVPFKKAEFNILWGVGIDKMGEIIEKGIEYDMIKKGGAWFTIGEEKYQGMNAVIKMMIDNPEYYEDLKKKVLIKLEE